ncbi:glycosyltransferase family 2 protein [Aquabacterium sp. A08]|uniref:glycosyltransferase family 2 protein n=1 Tax=Aquabacterium sp. A08 TaxID=2718532 RepID=UPI003530564B
MSLVNPVSAEVRAALERVTVVVVTFNSAHCLPDLGRALAACPQVVVVDNGSDDGCASLTPQHLPQAQVLALPQNLGFGAANNRALAQVRTPFALLLNPDCELAPEALAALVAAADADPQAAVLAPQLTNAQGRPDVNYRWPHLHWASRGPAADGPACVGFVCGAAMLCRLSAFEGVGFFDERFFLYYEDDDLCLRLFQARRPMVVVPNVTAVHRSRGSVRGNSPWRSEYLRGYHHAQSKLIFTAKHQTVARAQRQRRRLVGTTLLGLPLRLLLISPRLAARMVGRLRGALDWTPPHG